MCLASSSTLQIGLSFCPKGKCVCVRGGGGGIDLRWAEMNLEKM